MVVVAEADDLALHAGSRRGDEEIVAADRARIRQAVAAEGSCSVARNRTVAPAISRSMLTISDGRVYARWARRGLYVLDAATGAGVSRRREVVSDGSSSGSATTSLPLALGNDIVVVVVGALCDELRTGDKLVSAKSSAAGDSSRHRHGRRCPEHPFVGGAGVTKRSMRMSCTWPNVSRARSSCSWARLAMVISSGASDATAGLAFAPGRRARRARRAEVEKRWTSNGSKLIDDHAVADNGARARFEWPSWRASIRPTGSASGRGGRVWGTDTLGTNRLISICCCCSEEGEPAAGERMPH